MDTEGQHESPFAIPELWRKSVFTLPIAPPQTLFENADRELIDQEITPLASHLRHNFSRLDLDLRLPDIETFQYGNLESISPPETARADTDTDADGASTRGAGVAQSESDRAKEDVWQLSLDDPSERPQLRTWEAFSAGEKGEEVREKRVLYISEAGARVFDAALNEHAETRREDAGNVLESAFFVKALTLLGSGRSSALFQWGRDGREGEAVFKQTLERVRLSGVSLATAESVVEELGVTGSVFVGLRGFVQRVYAAKEPLAARIALAGCVQVVLDVLEQELAERVPGAQSLLQILGHFEVPKTLLREVQEMVWASRTAGSDLEFMQMVQGKVDEMARSCSSYQNVHLGILDRVSRPWLRDVSRRVGLSQGHLDVMPSSPSEEAEMLRGIDEGDAERIRELSAGLEMLKDSSFDHPLLNPAAWDVEQFDLDQSLVSIDAGHILDKARKYEEDLMHAIKQYNNGEKHVLSQKHDTSMNLPTDEDMAWDNTSKQQDYFADLGNRFAQPPDRGLPSLRTLPSELRDLIVSTTQPDHNNTNLDSPPQTHNPLHPLYPFLNAQARLINGTIIRLLFRHHDLRKHIELQYSYQLFGNGIFTQRLSSALFDADASSAERQRDRVIAGEHLGLRLDARREWPPGGSELRLALMGILSESHHSGSGDHIQELPGALSFSIRELSDSEIETVLNPHSIHALDFLRLSYETPSALAVLITETSLERYDEIFGSLLRLLRMVHVGTVMKTLSCRRGTHDHRDGRDGRRNNARAFATQAHHFVIVLAGFVFDIGIGIPWSNFTSILDSLEHDLVTEDELGTYGTHVRLGVSGLKDAHESMLDSMRARLLLRYKQVRAREVLDSVFTRILDVWRRIAVEGPGARVDGDEVEGLGREIRGFLELLRGMAGKAGRRGGGGERKDLEVMNVLRVRLDFNGFYSESGREGDG